MPTIVENLGAYPCDDSSRHWSVMPTYEYRCKDCGETMDVVQSIHDDALTVCPKCGGDLRKLFGNVGVVFKGSGFYKTDSRSKSSTGSPDAKPKSTSSDGKSDSSAGTSKTETASSTPSESSSPKSSPSSTSGSTSSDK